jgi:hypothetical protein
MLYLHDGTFLIAESSVDPTIIWSLGEESINVLMCHDML